MATYYVRTDGNDDTGDGSTGTPWLTLQKAITTAAAGDTILIGDGTYQETSGSAYLYITKNVDSFLTIQAENGAAGDVTIRGVDSATYSVRFGTGARNLRFKWLKFLAHVDTVNAIHLGAVNLSNLEFIGCTFTANSTGTTRSCVFGVPAGTAAYSGFLFDGCLFNQVGAGSAYGLRLYRNAAGDAISGVTVRDCRFETTDVGIFITGCTGIVIGDCQVTVTASDVAALVLGVDGVSAYPSSGTISNCICRSATGHALIVGGGCDGVTVSGCTAYGGNQAIVVKEATNVTIRGNNCLYGSDNSLYFKAATACLAEYNTIISNAGNALKVGINSVTGNKSGAITARYNHVSVYGTAKVLSWADDAGDSGGGVCDYNVYDGRPFAFGAVRASTNVITLEALRAAWFGYGDGSNDRHSSTGAVQGGLVGSGLIPSQLAASALVGGSL